MDATLHWWTLLSGVALVNVAAWLWTAVTVRRSAAHGPGDSRHLQLLLSAGYVFGCAYRSLLPVYDIQRLCLVDSWLSSVIVGRSVATVAELCFVAQWSVLLREAAVAARNPAALLVSRLLLPMIVVAEVCSWHAVLTTANLGHVVEESLWGTSAALVTACLWMLRRTLAPRLRPLMLFFCAAGAAYVLYMFTVDVPMYWARWIADEAQRRPYLPLLEGVPDAALRRVVSHRWEDWRTEVVWMSLYFSVAVWLSVALVHVRLPGRPREALAGVAHPKSA
ncbi:MAG TPA: hypothetical protein VJO99_08550 [Burkholderiaceae bacterium]|nr:hypothetical protein [Burkholderiaceae bacterium]